MQRAALLVRRRRRRSALESVTPARVSAAALRGRSATQAITIGPRIGPRPASSMPRIELVVDEGRAS